jgi:hypothetical protein
VLGITGLVWIASTALVVARPIGERTQLTLVSLAYPLAYLALSVLVSRRMGVGQRVGSSDRAAPR